MSAGHDLASAIAEAAGLDPGTVARIEISPFDGTTPVTVTAEVVLVEPDAETGILSALRHYKLVELTDEELEQLT